MLLTLLLLGCSDRADADGYPPFPDGRASEPAEDLGTVAESTDPDPKTEKGEGGEVEAGADTEAGGVMIDPVLEEQLSIGEAELLLVQHLIEQVGEEVAQRRPPGMAIPWYQRYSDEVAILLVLAAGWATRRFDLRAIGARLSEPVEVPVVAPLPPDDARRKLAAQLAETEAWAQREIVARDQRIALLIEGERRAAQQARQEALAARPLDRLADAELVEAMEARGRAAQERGRAR